MIRCEDGPNAWMNFRINGGDQTLAFYEGFEQEFEDDQQWMASLPTAHEDGLRVFVHAGLMPNHSLADQSDHTKMWIRDRFLRFPGPFPKYVVHGHTPISSADLAPSPDIRENRCNLDTGACYGGTLSAAFFNETEAKPFHTISVK